MAERTQGCQCSCSETVVEAWRKGLEVQLHRQRAGQMLRAKAVEGQAQWAVSRTRRHGADFDDWPHHHCYAAMSHC
jgi:hypothetical protein